MRSDISFGISFDVKFKLGHLERSREEKVASCESATSHAAELLRYEEFFLFS